MGPMAFQMDHETEIYLIPTNIDDDKVNILILLYFATILYNECRRSHTRDGCDGSQGGYCEWHITLYQHIDAHLMILTLVYMMQEVDPELAAKREAKKKAKAAEKAKKEAAKAAAKVRIEIKLHRDGHCNKL